MKTLFITILLMIGFHSLQVQSQSYEPSPANLKNRQWFDSARFGMFIHWGPSSLLGAGEWVMNNRNINVQDYQRLQNIFNPQAFDAEKWVTTAKKAGMQYITLITRHHDGFSLWDTKASNWSIMQTPYGKDIVRQLASECKKQGIRLIFYYSLLDWYRTDYPYETGRTGKGTGRTIPSNWEAYFTFMKNQLTELLTNYGTIDGIWFDGHWDQLENDHDKNAKPKINWRYNELYQLIHQLQPQCLVGNNHHLQPLAGEDFQMFEKDLPGGNTTGFGGASVSALPLETCETINDSWGFNITDRNYKSQEQLIHYLVNAAGFGANFLLNIGPLPNGSIQPEFTQRLESMGQWLKTYGSTIYGTKGGFIKPQPWGAITQKGNRYYLHLLKGQNDKLLLKVPFEVLAINTFDGGLPVKFQTLSDNYIVLHLKEVPKKPIDTILILEKK